jgi:hypothetical protein
MSCNRFQFLLSHLRMDDIAKRDQDRLRDKFAAAREVFELFNQVEHVAFVHLKVCVCTLHLTFVMQYNIKYRYRIFRIRLKNFCCK